MDHLYHGYVSHNQRVYLNIYFMAIFSSSLSSRKKHREELVPWLFSTSISYGSKSGWWFRPTPLKNHGVRQLELLLFPIYGKNGKIKHVPNHQPNKYLGGNYVYHSQSWVVYDMVLPTLIVYETATIIIPSFRW